MSAVLSASFQGVEATTLGCVHARQDFIAPFKKAVLSS